jgi:hypothetical protein
MGLIRGEDKGDGGVFFEWRDILKRVFRHIPTAYQKLKEDTDCGQDLIGVCWLLVQIGPHAKKEGGCKGAPIGCCLL